ncbi:MAG: response regulator transcription factor [Akkermansiaceae bacterium]
MLKRLRSRKQTPVLMLTSQDAPDDLIKGLDLGSDDYVTKPFHLDSLKARIRALFRRCSGSASSLIEFSSGLTIDTISRRVFLNDSPFELTAMELNLLELFLQRRGRILSKDTIADLLFEDADDGQSNTIEVHIYNLRKKLGRSVIKTRRRIGYELP